VRPRNVGCGSGGRTGDEPSSSSAVELVEKAGDSARAGRCSVGVLLPVPSSAAAAGGGDDCNEEIVWISARRGRVSFGLERGFLLRRILHKFAQQICCRKSRATFSRNGSSLLLILLRSKLG